MWRLILVMVLGCASFAGAQVNNGQVIRWNMPDAKWGTPAGEVALTPVSIGTWMVGVESASTFFVSPHMRDESEGMGPGWTSQYGLAFLDGSNELYEVQLMYDDTGTATGPTDVGQGMIYHGTFDDGDLSIDSEQFVSFQVPEPLTAGGLTVFMPFLMRSRRT